MTSNSEGDLKENENKELYFSYFIGRCNPPHQGHFEMINQTIHSAINKGGKALILLGSGPKAKDNGLDRRTLNDPLPFDFKRQLIESKINAFDYYQEEEKKVINEHHFASISASDYDIQAMTNTAATVVDFIEAALVREL